MYRIVYRGSVNGDVELITTKYSDKYIAEFVKACETLNLPQLDALGT